MRHLLIHIVLVMLPLPLAAQYTIQPDTLDWRGYYPLEIGNVWELRFEGAFRTTVRRLRIETDTLVAGQRWFVQTLYEEGWDTGRDVASYDTLLLRYDEPYGRILAHSPSTGEEWDHTCDLSGDFGAEVWCGADLREHAHSVPFIGYYASDPEYANSHILVGSDTVTYAAAKYSPVTGGWSIVSYYHGVGPLPSWGDDSYGGTITFSYLRLSGVEYGKAATFVGTERVPEDAAFQMAVYPNPARETLWIAVGDSDHVRSLSIYDGMGRLQQRYGACESPCRLSLGTIASGVYMVRAELDSGATVWRPFVAAR